MIVVATENFEVYHGVVDELRDRGVRFTTVEPGDDLPEATRVAVVGPTDEEPDVETVRAEPEDPRRAVDEALSVLRDGEGRTIVGVDPGDRPGIAVLSGGTVVAAFQVPADETAGVVAREIEDAADPLVRIGDGARLQGTRILEAIDDAPVELVDETGTTPYLGTGARGMGDVLAAVNIARLDGTVVQEREIEPTPGEIQRIKDRSRRESEAERTISERLARRVATGELSMAEALAAHREDE